MMRRIKLEFKKIPIKDFIDEFVYRIDLDADYQREKIWTTGAQQLLIDSIIEDIDIPKLYLAAVDNSDQFDYECIDGKQRITTLLKFFKPEQSEAPLKVETLGDSYTYERLKEEHPTVAEKIENYELHISIFRSLTEKKVRKIFQRLQLGVRLNSGEILNAKMGTIRDFVFKAIGKFGPFMSKTRISEKRFSREFTLSQMCINSFNKKSTGEFKRARLVDLETFFERNDDLDKDDENLKRISEVLNLMDKGFGKKAERITSRAVAVSAYLFCEELFQKKQKDKIPEFATFYIKLLDTIKENMGQLRIYKPPPNIEVQDKFQKYVLQASVEPYSIRNRHNFLTKAFEEYQRTGKIIGA